MYSILLTSHIVFISIALGGRILFIPLLNERIAQGFNERLDQLHDILKLTKYADIALILSAISGIILFVIGGTPITHMHWSFKLKLVTLALLVTDIGAFHLAQMRVTNHYDSQMVPALKRLNSLAVILMCCMVLFATFKH